MAIKKPIDLNDFRNPAPQKLDVWTTSLNLEQKHREFIERQNLNLSKLVRKFLDDLIRDSEK